MDKSEIDDKMQGREFNVRLESFIDFGQEDCNYKKLNIELPAWAYIRLFEKKVFETDFLTLLGSSVCTVEFLKGVIENENKKEMEKMQRILGNI